MKVACYSLFSTIVQKYSNIFENNSKVLTFFPIATRSNYLSFTFHLLITNNKSNSSIHFEN